LQREMDEMEKNNREHEAMKHTEEEAKQQEL
jgi:hypothetical protein